MLGYVIFQRRCSVQGREEERCGGRFFCVYLPEKPRKRQIQKAARLLKKRKVKRAVFPVGYDASPWKKWGVEPMNGLLFRRRLLTRILFWALDRKVCSCAGMYALRVDFSVRQVARHLAGECRYLFLDCGEETEDLSCMLQREWGIAAVREPSAERLSNCDLLLLFAPRQEVDCRGVVLPFYKGAEIPWQYRFRGMEACPMADIEQLGAALFEMGILREKDVEIIKRRPS